MSDKPKRKYVLTVPRAKPYPSNLNIRVTPEQLSRWRDAARDGELSEWVRGVLDRAAKWQQAVVARSERG